MKKLIIGAAIVIVVGGAGALIVYYVKHPWGTVKAEKFNIVEDED